MADGYTKTVFLILADNVLQKNLTAIADNPIRTWFWVTAKEEVGNRMSYFAIWFSNVTTLQLKTAPTSRLVRALAA